MRDEVVQAGYRQASDHASARLVHDDDAGLDPDAVAAIAVGAVINHRRTRWTFGTPPADVNEERFLETWVELLVRAVQGAPSPPDP